MTISPPTFAAIPDPNRIAAMVAQVQAGVDMRPREYREIARGLSVLAPGIRTALWWERRAREPWQRIRSAIIAAHGEDAQTAMEEYE
jgi:hypothetical protein